MSVQTRIALGDYYNYREIKSIISEKEKQKIKKRFLNLTNNWNENVNSEWVLRHYLSAKMIMSSTLMLNSMIYAKDQNLAIVEPYLHYYALLSSCRSLLFTVPEVEWNDGNMMIMNHEKIINSATNAISSIDKRLGEEVKNTMQIAKDIREFFSYKFPANGMSTIIEMDQLNLNSLVKMCTQIVEIAQLYSEQLQSSLGKVDQSNFTINTSVLKKGWDYHGKQIAILDQEDWYRLDYFIRKQPFPVSIYWTMREGMTEDFFGAWILQDCTENKFDPMLDLNVIFDIP